MNTDPVNMGPSAAGAGRQRKSASSRGKYALQACQECRRRRAKVGQPIRQPIKSILYSKGSGREKKMNHAADLDSATASSLPVLAAWNADKHAFMRTM